MSAPKVVQHPLWMLSLKLSCDQISTKHFQKRKEKGVAEPLNDNTGKRIYGLLLKDAPQAVDAIVDHFHYGAFERERSNGEKGYGRANWNEPDTTGKWMDDNLESIDRHMAGLRKGQTHDEDGKRHDVACCVRLIMRIQRELQ